MMSRWHNIKPQDRAANYLRRVGGGRAGHLLMHLLQTAHPQTRILAAEALGQLSAIEAVDALIQALSCGHPAVTNTVVSALREIGAEAVEPLARALENESISVKKIAAQILGELNDRRAVNALISCLEAEDPMVRAAAATSLGKIADRSVVASLVRCLRDRSETVAVRVCAANALGWTGDAAAFTPLTKTLTDAQSPVRAACAKALVRLGDARAVPILVHHMKTETHRKTRASMRRAVKDLARYTRTVRSMSAFCQDCLSRFRLYRIRVNPVQWAAYYACRSCQCSANYFVGVQKVVLVIDREFSAAFLQKEGALYINWFMLDKQRQVELFDFDEVALSHVDDPFEIDEFIMRLRNDPDDERAKKYRQLPITIYGQIPEGKQGLLESVFGSV